MKNNFDFIAPFYDRLSRIVFGKKLIEAQKHNHKYLSSDVRVLVIGGGNGEILESMPSVKEVHYVELSARMIGFAKKRKTVNNVTFLKVDLRAHTGVYDVIMANFFYDCFNEYELQELIIKTAGLLNPEGVLLVTDFKPAKGLSQRILLKFMHLFFKVVSNLSTNHLQDINQSILDSQYYGLMEHENVSGLLFRAVYKKAT